jgi:hypothetical protein
MNASVAVYVRQVVSCVSNWVYILQNIQVGLNNPVLVTLAGYKDFLHLFIRFGDYGNIHN